MKCFWKLFFYLTFVWLSGASESTTSTPKPEIQNISTTEIEIQETVVTTEIQETQTKTEFQKIEINTEIQEETTEAETKALKVTDGCGEESPSDLSGYWITQKFPGPYPATSLTCTKTFEEGYVIKITIEKFDINSSKNSYVLIEPGGTLENTQKGIVLAWNINKKEYLIPSNTVYMKFTNFGEDSSGNTGFKIKWERYGQLTTTTELASTTEAFPTPGPDEAVSYTVYIAINSQKFLYYVPAFQKLLARKATEYCKDRNMELRENITVNNVVLKLAIQCVYLWPNAETCTEVRFAIPVFIKQSKEYQLKQSHLQRIWESISNEEMKNEIQLEKYYAPDDNFTLTLWLIIIIIIVVLFFGFLFYMRQIGIKFENLSRKRKPSDLVDLTTQSTRQSDVSLWPTQVTPPIFDIADDNYSQPRIAYRGYSGAYNNPNYQMDDEFSDEEVLNVTNIPKNESKFILSNFNAGARESTL